MLAVSEMFAHSIKLLLHMYLMIFVSYIHRRCCSLCKPEGFKSQDVVVDSIPVKLEGMLPILNCVSVALMFGFFACTTLMQHFARREAKFSVY